jgi:Fur family ferric uptake transcriptional regulator
MGPDDELRQIERALRRRGLRWTNQRKLVASVALRNHAHFSAEQLLELCREQDRAISRATVYRTLGMLEDAGFVEGLDTGEGGRKFEHVLGHAHHDHMICTSCGAIIEFRDDELERRQDVAARRHGFSIASHSLKLYGVCRACAKKPDRRAAGGDSGERA